MAVTIDQEAKTLKRSINDVDRYRRRYITTETDEETLKDLFINFSAPSIIIWENFRFYLMKNSARKELEPKHYYRPDYVAYNEYGTTVLWNLILFINNIPSIEEFKIDTILVPTYSSVLRIAREALVRQIPEEVVKSWQPTYEESAYLYHTKQYPATKPVSVPSLSVDKNFYYAREVILVSSRIASDEYIDLQNVPILNTLSIKVSDQKALILDQDYKLVNSLCTGNRKQRISWNRRKYPDISTNLSKNIIVGNSIEIQYSRQTDSINAYVEV